MHMMHNYHFTDEKTEATVLQRNLGIRELG